MSGNNQEFGYGSHNALVRLYPSTEAKEARTSRTGRHSVITPAEMQEWEREFRKPDSPFRPLHFMHNHGTKRSDRIGNVKDIWYNKIDKWLWAKVDGLTETVKNVFEMGKLNEISLKYVQEHGKKRPLEVSALSLADYPAAQVIMCHSGETPTDELRWPLGMYGLAPLAHISKHANSNSTARKNSVSDTPYQYSNLRSTMEQQNYQQEPAEASGQQQPMDQLKAINNLPEDKRLEALTKLVSHVGATSKEMQQMQEQHQQLQAQTQEMEKRYQEAEKQRINMLVRQNFASCKWLVSQRPSMKGASQKEIDMEATKLAKSYIVKDQMQALEDINISYKAARGRAAGAPPRMETGKRKRESENKVTIPVGSDSAMQFPVGYMNEQNKPNYQYVMAHGAREGTAPNKTPRLGRVEEIFNSILNERAASTAASAPVPAVKAPEPDTFSSGDSQAQFAYAMMSAERNMDDGDVLINERDMKGMIQAHGAIVGALEKTEKSEDLNHVLGEYNKTVLANTDKMGFYRDAKDNSLLANHPKMFFEILNMGQTLEPMTNAKAGIYGKNALAEGKKLSIKSPKVNKFFTSGDARYKTGMILTE